jgi:hypothetical protein
MNIFEQMFAEMEGFRKKVAVARNAHALHVEHLKQYQELCLQGNWQAAEYARVATVSAMEAYLDALKAIYMQKENM